MSKPFKVVPGRPTCATKGCNSPCQNSNTVANPRWRKYCNQCHIARMNKRQETLRLIDRRTLPKCAIVGCRCSVRVNGLTHDRKYIKLSNMCEKHTGSTLKDFYKKDYCENIDGRLGFVCQTLIIIPRQLQVDHIDGNPYNEPEDGSNFQTLCACCHIYKSEMNGDYNSAGRKTLRPKETRIPVAA